MTCKKCINSEVKNWFENLIFISLLAMIPVGIVGLGAVWIRSWDGYDYNEHDYVEKSMNWLAFGIFGAMLLAGVVTLMSFYNPPEDCEIQDK